VTRISKEAYYLGVASAVAKRSTCLRRQYGAIIVQNDEIVSTGYNGASRGEPNCCDLAYCYREKNNIAHGEQYEKCVAVHAEQNAIISASRREMIGAVLYLVGYSGSVELKDAAPCLICRRMIANTGIKKVITWADLEIN
jgi:Deoxycytidylate deaminase